MLAVGSLKQRARAAIAAAAMVAAGTTGAAANEPKPSFESCDGLKPGSAAGICPVPEREHQFSDLKISSDFRPTDLDEPTKGHHYDQAISNVGSDIAPGAAKLSRWKRALAWFSGATSVAMIYPYLPNVIRGVANANPASFFIWVINDAAMTGNALASGDPNSFMLGLGWTLSSTLCLGVALRWGNKNRKDAKAIPGEVPQPESMFNPLEKKCLGMASIGVVCYAASQSPLIKDIISPHVAAGIGSTLAFVVSCLGCAPTLKGWFSEQPVPGGLRPRREIWGNLIPWWAALAGVAASLMSVEGASLLPYYQQGLFLIPSIALALGSLKRELLRAGPEVSVSQLLFKRRQGEPVNNT